MKNTKKMFGNITRNIGITALVAVLGLVLSGCDKDPPESVLKSKAEMPKSVTVSTVLTVPSTTPKRLNINVGIAKNAVSYRFYITPNTSNGVITEIYPTYKSATSTTATYEILESDIPGKVTNQGSFSLVTSFYFGASALDVSSIGTDIKWSSSRY